METLKEIFKMYTNGDEVCATCSHAKEYGQKTSFVLCTLKAGKAFEVDNCCDKWEPNYSFSAFNPYEGFRNAKCCAICQHYESDEVEDSDGCWYETNEGYCDIRETTVDCFKVCENFEEKK